MKRLSIVSKPFLCLLAAGAFLLGCSAQTAVARPTAAQVIALDVPRATSTTIRAPRGSALAAEPIWAIVPMGEPGVVADAFWELLVLRRPQASWSLVTPPGVADNGGIVGSFLPAGGVVGVLPTGLLAFSPVASTENAGRRWSPGILPGPLAPVPDAVATAPGGHLLALLGATGSSIVDSDDDAATTTSPISSLRAIATAGGRLCNLTALTADAFGPAGQPMVGGRCQSSEQVGIFELVANRWKLIGPSAPRSAVTEGASPHMPHPAITGSPASRSVVTEVLRLATEGSSVVALAEAVATDGTASLFQLRRSSLGAWTSSAAFDAPSSEQLMATGNEPNGSSFVLLSRDGSLTAIVLPSAGSHWSKLPSPPAGTATLVLGAGGVTEALAVHGSLLTVFALERSRRWSQVQVINVPIDVGASP